MLFGQSTTIVFSSAVEFTVTLLAVHPTPLILVEAEEQENASHKLFTMVRASSSTHPPLQPQYLVVAIVDYETFSYSCSEYFRKFQFELRIG